MQKKRDWFYSIKFGIRLLIFFYDSLNLHNGDTIIRRGKKTIEFAM